ncbi:MAG: transcription antitermination factor NusB [Clostridia bacterium]|nr:transcription antitermination factor NusB [Clostridia bacterium]MDE7306635.1 transcription antitermination factor NusB [Clostridia bacterium]
MRTTARETLFKIVFASQFSQVDGVFKSALYKTDKLDEKDISYCENILSLIETHRNEIAEIIDGRSRLFPESRLFPADRSLLQIAISEILYCDDVPNAVAANEAANIASKYSTDKSASFISGVLAEIIREK